MVAPFINSIKNTFLIPTDSHYYTNHKMLKTIKKIITLASTCFGSRRNRHQGAVLCLAKTTEYGFSLCSSIYMQSMLWWHISLLCGCAVHSGGSSCLHCEPHTCTTGWYATITLTAYISTSTKKSHTL